MEPGLPAEADREQAGVVAEGAAPAEEAEAWAEWGERKPAQGLRVTVFAPTAATVFPIK